MSDNPFIKGQTQGKGLPVTADRIREYCETLNRTNWVRASGQPYRCVMVRIGDEDKLTLERFFPKKDDLRKLGWAQ